MKKILCLAVLLFLAGDLHASERKAGSMPAPRLIAPFDDTEIQGESLEFSWDAQGDRPEYYDFRLYKGHETLEAGMILKEKVPPAQKSFSVKSDTFEAGQTYAWSVRTVGTRGKSRSNHSVFKVIQRQG